MAKKKGSGKYRVEAQVCDIIKSTPVTRQQANQLKNKTKQRIPKAKVKIKKA